MFSIVRSWTDGSRIFCDRMVQTPPLIYSDNYNMYLSCTNWKIKEVGAEMQYTKCQVHHPIAIGVYPVSESSIK